MSSADPQQLLDNRLLTPNPKESQSTAADHAADPGFPEIEEVSADDGEHAASDVVSRDGGAPAALSRAQKKIAALRLTEQLRATLQPGSSYDILK